MHQPDTRVDSRIRLTSVVEGLDPANVTIDQCKEAAKLLLADAQKPSFDITVMTVREERVAVCLKPLGNGNGLAHCAQLTGLLAAQVDADRATLISGEEPQVTFQTLGDFAKALNGLAEWKDRAREAGAPKLADKLAALAQGQGR